MSANVETQKYGVEIAPGASDFFSVEADLSGNVTGPISNQATGSHQIVNAMGAHWTYMGGNAGFGTRSPANNLTVACSPRPFSDAQAGGACAQFGVGSGASTDDAIFAGVLSGSYAWIQAAKPGTGTRPLMVNPNGGAVALGRSGMSPASTDGWPAIPVTAGAPVGTPTGIPAGFAPIQADSSGNKLWIYLNGTWLYVGTAAP